MTTQSDAEPPEGIKNLRNYLGLPYATPELQEAIWQVIKGWDLERNHGEGYAGATGTDVQTILDAVEPVFQARAAITY